MNIRYIETIVKEQKRNENTYFIIHNHEVAGSIPALAT